MVSILRIERAIDWIPAALIANRDSNPIPEGFWSAVMPTVEIFGSQRASEVQVGTVLGGLGSVEEFHTLVASGRVRHYLSMEYSTDDPGPTFLRAGRIVSTAAGFPFAGFRDDVSVVAGQHVAVRNFSVGPNQRAAVQANAMGAAARMTLEVAWVEFPLGESVRLE